MIVCSRTITDENRRLADGLSDVRLVRFDIEEEGALTQLKALVTEVDLVVSLLPYVHHVKAARVAIELGKHFASTSYISDEMAALDAEAKAAGVMLLNEMGVDPGLDLASAQKILDEVHAHGGKVYSFYSICGGLPAPDANNLILPYKCSWSPRGVLLAARNNALFLLDGKIVSIPSVNLFVAGKHTDFVEGAGALEWVPNRDSIKFIEVHNCPEVKTIVRGTYRYPTWCDFMKALVDTGLLSLEPLPIGGMIYSSFTWLLLGVEKSASTDIEHDFQLQAAVAAKLNLDANHLIIQQMGWLGLFSNKEKIHQKVKTPLDALCQLCSTKLVYADGERDMIVMKHTFEVSYRPAHRQTITSVLLDLGLQDKGGFSSMSRTVSLPVAAVSLARLDGRLDLVGLQRPVNPSIYNLVLPEMEKLNIKFVESVEKPHLWIRHEVKAAERRVILTPNDVAQLISVGFKVSVERSPTRCFSDVDYALVGAILVPKESWRTAPWTAIIIGLKELPEEEGPLIHRHVYFAHCFKNQTGWKELLRRFSSGEGMLWDLEFLVDDNQRRIAAFGGAAGIAGMALGLLTWANQKLSLNQKPKGVDSWPSTQALIADVSTEIKAALKKEPTIQPPHCLVVGALGRVGSKAAWFAEQCGATVTRWDLKETANIARPTPEMLTYDVLVNCIYLNGDIPPFMTRDLLVNTLDRKLSVFVDISCDLTNIYNPFPIYDRLTTFEDPALRIIESSTTALPFDVVSIDNLPTMIPSESSVEFSGLLLPHVRNLEDPNSPVWKRGEDLFYAKCKAASS